MLRLSHLQLFGASLNWPINSFDTPFFLDFWFAKMFLSQFGSNPFSMEPGSFSGKWYFSTKVWMLGMLIAPVLIIVSRPFGRENQKYKQNRLF